MGDFSNRMSGDVNMDTVGLVLVASWICLWTCSELSSMTFLLLHSESNRHSLCVFLPFRTSGWLNRKNRSSCCCWGHPFLVAMHRSGVFGESNISMEVCLTCHCLVIYLALRSDRPLTMGDVENVLSLVVSTLNSCCKIFSVQQIMQ
jgi:hypothetical protein